MQRRSAASRLGVFGGALAVLLLILPAYASATTWTGNWKVSAVIYYPGNSIPYGGAVCVVGNFSIGLTTGQFSNQYHANVQPNQVGEGQIWCYSGFWSPVFSYSSTTSGAVSAKWNWSGLTDAVLAAYSGTGATANASTNAWAGIGVFATSSSRWTNPAWVNQTFPLWNFAAAIVGGSPLSAGWSQVVSSTGTTFTTGGSVSFSAGVSYQVWTYVITEVDLTVSYAVGLHTECTSGYFTANFIDICTNVNHTNTGYEFGLMQVTVP